MPDVLSVGLQNVLHISEPAVREEIKIGLVCFVRTKSAADIGRFFVYVGPKKPKVFFGVHRKAVRLFGV